MTEGKPYRRLAVVGTPCGGTTRLAKLLKAYGLQVEKERLGRDGTVCGFFVWGRMLDKVHRRHKPMPEDYEWGQVWTLVRHPLLVAATLPRFAPRSNRFSWQVDDAVTNAMRYWVETMERGLQWSGMDNVIRVGTHYAADFERLRQSLGLPSEPVSEVPADHNHKKGYRWPRVTWPQWDSRDFAYAQRARTLLGSLGMLDAVDAA